MEICKNPLSPAAKSPNVTDGTVDTTMKSEKRAMLYEFENNLFNYATSELSQDAFLCWLASYALEDAEPDDALRSCAREMLELFVPELKGRPFTLKDVERQVWHIDALLASDLSRGLFFFL